MSGLESVQTANSYVPFYRRCSYNLGHHRLAFGKFVVFEHSLRIPMVFAGPGVQHGSTIDFLGTNVDMAPTLLGLAGIRAPNGTDGVSVVPLLVSEKVASEQHEQVPASVLRHLKATSSSSDGSQLRPQLSRIFQNSAATRCHSAQEGFLAPSDTLHCMYGRVTLYVYTPT